VVSVRECLFARQAGCPCRAVRFCALAQVSGHIGGALSSHGALMVIALIAVVFAALVIFPAVWSRKPARRKAALAVLDRLLRWRG
jgi:Flp pilus assembly protein TadB